MRTYNKIPSVFNKEQIYSLFDAINTPDVMMACIIGIFCGLRITEITTLRYLDIDFVKKQLKVNNGKMPGKNLAGYGKDRIVPIPSQIIPLFIMWKNMHPNAEYLFTSLSKEIKPITSKQIFKKYKKCLEKANLIVFRKFDTAGHKKNLYNFHTLRHTYATLLWERTGDIYAVKQALGHSDLEITMVYTHVSDIALQNKINTAFESPMPYRSSHKVEEVSNNLNPKSNTAMLKQDNPIEILKARLAKGELKLEEFRQLRSELIITPDTDYFG